ncbi:MAG: OmpH family outer membrane protein [Bacteroidaceae bacterium]|nr:OmpH family outer membrane protein [Bacteroidaceae bacterium]
MKKLIAIALVALAPISVFAQKFGHINSSDILILMPDYKEAQTEIETLSKQYEEELKYMETEYTKKVDDYQKQAETLPDNIRQRREQEIMESRQKAEQYYSDCQINLQNKSNELMEKIQTKLTKAIQTVGEEGAYVCIFDIAGGVVPFVSSTLTTDVTESVKAKLGIK